MHKRLSTTSTLHIVLGPPASGKTTYATRLASQLKATLVDIDIATEPVVRGALGALGLDPNDRDSPEYKRHFREPVYETLFAIAAANLPHTDVVLTGPFTREMEDPNWLASVAETRLPRPWPIKAYYMSCPTAELRRRMELRANPRDAAKLADWNRYQAYYGAAQPPAFTHELIDSTRVFLG